MKQSLPIARINQLKEASRLRLPGTISLLNRAPHPNGAKVLVNWLLSRDAQSLIQKTDGSDSLRIDIPKDSVLPENRRLTSVRISQRRRPEMFRPLARR